MNKNIPTKKTAKERHTISIGQYLNEVAQYLSFPAKIKNGIMKIQYGGRLISKQEFDKLVKHPPVINSFLVNLENVDSTRKWLNS